MPLIHKVSRTINENKMLDRGSRILTGISGGPDSVALLYLLSAIGLENDYHIGVAHINHGLRGESADLDAVFVETLAKKLNVPYYAIKVDLFAIRKKTGTCLEEAGREVRYAFFHETADQYGFDKIAVGHHLEDDAELILMNIIRGSGPTGMAGIPPVRGRVVRPLIHCRRKEILSFLKSRNINYVHDETNANTLFQRNHIRHCLIPALEHYNPRIVENLHRMGRLAGCENEWTEHLVSPVFDAVVSERKAGCLMLDIQKLTPHHLAVKRRILRKVILEVKGNLRRIGTIHIDAVAELMEKEELNGQLDLPERIRVVRSGMSLMIKAEKRSLRSPELSGRRYQQPFAIQVPETLATSGVLDIPETGFKLEFNRLMIEEMDNIPFGGTVALDWEKLVFPLCIRNIKPGDRFMPFGMSRTQKVKHFFINNKIPVDKRSSIPLLISGSQVIWIAGLRMDDRYRITETTKIILKVKSIYA